MMTEELRKKYTNMINSNECLLSLQIQDEIARIIEQSDKERWESVKRSKSTFVKRSTNNETRTI